MVDLFLNVSIILGTLAAYIIIFSNFEEDYRNYKEKQDGESRNA